MSKLSIGVLDQSLIDATKQVQEAVNHYQRIADRQIDDLRVLQQSGWKDVNAMSKLDSSAPQLESARLESERLMKKYFEAGGMEPIYVHSRHSRH